MVYRYRTFNKVSITVQCQSFWTLGIFRKDLTIRESFWSNKFTVEYFTKLVFLGTGDIPRSEGILGQKYFFIVEEDFTKRESFCSDIIHCKIFHREEVFLFTCNEL